MWSSVEALIPPHDVYHPLGCHRLRARDQLVFEALLWRTTTGCSYDEIGLILGVSSRTIRRRRDEWADAGVFENLFAEALAGYDKIIGLQLDDISIDGCITKAPCGGEVAGKSPVDRGKRGTKRSIGVDAIGVDAVGVPIAVVCAPANTVDFKLLGATLDHVELLDLPALSSLHLDRGYDNKVSREMVLARGYDSHIATKKTAREVRSIKRWAVERTNAWHNNFGQLRRATDRTALGVRVCALLASVVIILRKLVARRYRYMVGA
jgi:transposase